jgi:hypothetical protein
LVFIEPVTLGVHDSVDKQWHKVLTLSGSVSYKEQRI